MKLSKTNQVVIFAPTSTGGLAEHVHYQADALHRAGIQVLVLCEASFLHARHINYPFDAIFDKPSLRSGVAGKVSRILYRIKLLSRLEEYLKKMPCDILLLESYVEYFSPLWIQYLLKIRQRGVRIGCNLHDPVRDFVIGPLWWHHWCCHLAYQPMSFILVHQIVPREARVPDYIEKFLVPVGIYNDNLPPPDSSFSREKLGLSDHMRVYLSFGYIRDNKNLDLFIRAMQHIPDVFLIVAGRDQSSSQKPSSYYKQLADSCNVSERVHFDTSFISEEKISLYFSACDQVLLTYARSFLSQSGVLNIAAKYQKPVLASSGNSPLKDVVQRFQLGQFIQPDNIDSIVDALSHPRTVNQPDWQAYSEYATWEQNISPLLKLLDVEHHSFP